MQCGKCRTLYPTPDTDFPTPCPDCGEQDGLVTVRCDQCPVTEIETVREVSQAGHLLERVLELDFDCDRFQIGWDEVTYEEGLGLKILSQERRKWEAEEAEEKKEEMEMERRARAPSLPGTGY